MRALAAALLLMTATAHAARVVSLNLCADDFLVLLAPEQIVALSPLARDPSLSVVAAQAARLPWVRADAEAVLALHPDLVLGETRRLAAMLGEPARGEALLARMDRELAVSPRRHPTAVALEARGWSAGPGSLTDAVLTRAGLRDVGTGGQMTIEALAGHPPDLLVVATPPDYPSLATDMLGHPALAAIPRRAVPPALLACGGPWTARAVALLAQ